MAQPSTLEYTTLSERAQSVVDNLIPPHDKTEAAAKKFAHVKPLPPNKDGDTEVLKGVTFTHHFAYGPGDYERVLWHYVTTGPLDGEPIVFLHGIPDSWYQWHRQLAALSSKSYYCLSIDLKGYGQSEKSAGDYRHEAVSEQLYALLTDVLHLKSFNIVTHDRGTVQADFLVAKHPESVLRYGRGEQHLYHFHPSLAPQGDLFRDAPYSGMFLDPVKFVTFCYTWITLRPVPDAEMERTIQEWAFEGTAKAVPRYFNSSTFRQEWIARRSPGGLLERWKCPVLIMQGKESKTQPWEWYVDARKYIPNAKDVKVRFIEEACHYWPTEQPELTTKAVEELLAMPVD
ncbi:Haloalkane dehalogenase [Cyphellophora attinorum]|uniref:Haloalkane dehalogenase n=1 Tax=Cyphellophora attinorum TaxID=1664694 RepID=A0A0N1H086_9EURO|nr:Haloalkane dehalogenase [Phialophora attinorum]KPI37042.1 Haloalkane dehalogenase [Phialophora attinorum]